MIDSFAINFVVFAIALLVGAISFWSYLAFSAWYRRMIRQTIGGYTRAAIERFLEKHERSLAALFAAVVTLLILVLLSLALIHPK